MSFRCGKCLATHETTLEARVCYGLVRPPAPVVSHYSDPHEYGREPVTRNQLDYIRALGGDMTYAVKLSKPDASQYIDKLKAGKSSTSRSRSVPEDPRLGLIKGMIDAVPDGYFAVQKEEGATVHFLRLSHPKIRAGVSRNRFAGALKIQTQHGPRLEVAAVLWPGGTWSLYAGNAVIDMLMLLVADWQGATQRYAEKLGHCMRCNAELTDDRSRHYGIGPECETKPGWEWVIPMVDERSLF